MADHTPTRFPRLVAIELRKVAVTRSTRWVLISMLAIAVLLAIATMLISKATGSSEASYALELLALTVPVAIGTPIIGVLIATGDWQHREVTTIFSLVPQRSRIFAAKLSAALVLSVALIVAVAVASCVISLVVAPLVGMQWSAGDVGRAVRTLAVAAIFGSLSGAAIGSAVLSAPLSIIIVFVQALVLDAALLLIPGNVGSYFQGSSVTGFLLGDGPFPAAATSAMLWLVTPLVIGYLRNKHREIG